MNNDEVISLLREKGINVFGSLDSYIEWTETPILELGWKRPKDMLETYDGIKSIMDILKKIESSIG